MHDNQPSKALALLTACVCITSAITARAQGWDNLVSPGALSVSATAIGTDSDGNIFVLGRRDVGKTSVVLKFGPAGQPLSAQDLPALPGQRLSGPRAFAANDDTLHIGGFFSAEVYNWITYESTDAGNTWLADEIVPNAQCYGIIADGSGGLYACGNILSGASYVDWHVRYRHPDGNWQPVYTYEVPKGPSYAKGMALHPAGGLLIAGSAFDPKSRKLRWEVHWLQPDGRWIAEDTFASSSGDAEAASIAVSPSGDIYAAGYAGDFWVVRRKDAQSGEWSSSEQYRPFKQKPSNAKGIAFDSAGNVYIAGLAWTSSSGYFAVRKGTLGPDGKMSWTPSDLYQPAPGVFARAEGICSNPSGSRLFAVGGTLSGDNLILRSNPPLP